MIIRNVMVVFESNLLKYKRSIVIKYPRTRTCHLDPGITKNQESYFRKKMLKTVLITSLIMTASIVNASMRSSAKVSASDCEQFDQATLPVAARAPVEDRIVNLPKAKSKDNFKSSDSVSSKTKNKKTFSSSRADSVVEGSAEKVPLTKSKKLVSKSRSGKAISGSSSSESKYNSSSSDSDSSSSSSDSDSRSRSAKNSVEKERIRYCGSTMVHFAKLRYRNSKTSSTSLYSNT